MHFGEALEDDQFTAAVHYAYEKGIRTFVTADVYGQGESDSLLARSLDGFSRDSYCLVGAVGHDFYHGQREGSKGFPRFTDPALRGEDAYADYLRMATEKSLARCQSDHFDLLLLHNPDVIGYTSTAVWDGMAALKSAGLATRLGIAPGPANGFALDLIQSLERFESHIDWAMIILNPMEPWPGRYVLPVASEFGVDILARVVDYGGIFHDDVKPGHFFKDGDHRTYRGAGWIEHGNEKLERMRPIAEKYGLTMLQFACIWNLSQAPVKSVGPTFIQEAGDDVRPVEEKISEFAKLPDVTFTPDEVREIFEIGNNEGCMELKGASIRHEGIEPQPDHWPMRSELEPYATKWHLNPAW